MTIDIILKHIKDTPELQNIIMQSESVRDGLGVQHFWNSADGIKFRYTYERISGNSSTGVKNRSLIKDAVALYIAEVNKA